MRDEPVFSVCVITYNHERFVSECLDRALSQRTSFPYEVVVGEDHSSDATLTICRRYEQRDARVRVISSAENKGMARNFVDTLSACQGKYLALCEGDDYWIDAMKLQRQHDFLEAHPDHSLCFHNGLIEYPDGHHDVWRQGPPKGGLRSESLFSEWLMPTASVAFRNPGAQSFPSYLSKATHGDLGLFVFLADRGHIGYIDRVMSVYRRHAGGIMSSFAGVDFHRKEVAFLIEMNEWFRTKYRRPIYERIGRLKRASAVQLAADGRVQEGAGELLASFRFWTWPPRGVVGAVARFGVLAAMPRRLRAHVWRRRVRSGA